MIESIKIKIGEKSIELSPEEAKQLRDSLDEVLGKHVCPTPYYIPYVPYYPYRIEPVWEPPYRTTWDTGTATVTRPLQTAGTVWNQMA